MIKVNTKETLFFLEIWAVFRLEHRGTILLKKQCRKSIQSIQNPACLRYIYLPTKATVKPAATIVPVF